MFKIIKYPMIMDIDWYTYNVECIMTTYMYPWFNERSTTMPVRNVLDWDNTHSHREFDLKGIARWFEWKVGS